MKVIWKNKFGLYYQLNIAELTEKCRLRRFVCLFWKLPGKNLPQTHSPHPHKSVFFLLVCFFVIFPGHCISSTCSTTHLPTPEVPGICRKLTTGWAPWGLITPPLGLLLILRLKIRISDYSSVIAGGHSCSPVSALIATASSVHCTVLILSTQCQDRLGQRIKRLQKIR